MEQPLSLRDDSLTFFDLNSLQLVTTAGVSAESDYGSAAERGVRGRLLWANYPAWI